MKRGGAWALMALLVVGCDDDEDAPRVRPTPPSETQTSRPDEPTSEGRPEEGETTAWPAFAVYESNRTILVPLDGGPILDHPLLLLYAQRDGRERVARREEITLADIRSASIPDCACGGAVDSGESCFVDEAEPNASGETDTLFVTFDARTGRPVGEGNLGEPIRCACRFDEGLRERLEQAQPEPGEDDGEPGSYEDCTESWVDDASLIGGGLQTFGSVQDTCGGFNSYDAVGEYVQIFAPVPGPPVPDALVEELGCEPDAMPGDSGPPAIIEEPACPPGEEGDGLNGEECYSCAHGSGDASVELLRRGYVWVIEQSQNHAGGSTWFRRYPARESSCPSPEDPCGDPSAFPALGDSDSEFWVATDGSAALEIDDGRFRLHVRGAAEVRTGPFQLQTPLGVQFHADASRLRAQLEHPPRRRVERATGPCRHNLDCDAFGQCGFACEDGRCVQPGDPSSGEAASGAASGEAASGEAASGETGHESAPDEAASNEASTTPTGGARALARQCDAHRRDGDLAAARRDCERALTLSPPRPIRGAILYNLGRMAEDRDDRGEARRRYRESLEARPNNRIVQRRLEALASP